MGRESSFSGTGAPLSGSASGVQGHEPIREVSISTVVGPLSPLEQRRTAPAEAAVSRGNSQDVRIGKHIPLRVARVYVCEFVSDTGVRLLIRSSSA
jgi:hypothetical protein